MSSRRHTPTATLASWSIPECSTAFRSRRQKRRSSAGFPKIKRASRRSTSSCATGSFRASGTGASRSRSSTAATADMCRSTKASCRCACRRSIATSRPATVIRRWPQSTDGSMSSARNAVRLPNARRTQCLSGPVRHGISCVTATRTTTRSWPQRRRSTTGCRSTGTTAAWSIRRCICSTHASGISFCMTSASCRRRSRMPSEQATA